MTLFDGQTRKTYKKGFEEWVWTTLKLWIDPLTQLV